MFDNAGMPKTTNNFINLLLEDQKALNEFGELEGKELIFANMTLQSNYAKEYLIYDRQLAHTYLKSCYDATLTAKINEKMIQYENPEKGAPLFFFHMLELTCLSSNLDLRFVLRWLLVSLLG